MEETRLVGPVEVVTSTSPPGASVRSWAWHLMVAGPSVRDLSWLRKRRMEVKALEDPSLKVLDTLDLFIIIWISLYDIEYRSIYIDLQSLRVLASNHSHGVAVMVSCPRPMRCLPRATGLVRPRSLRWSAASAASDLVHDRGARRNRCGLSRSATSSRSFSYPQAC